MTGMSAIMIWLLCSYAVWRIIHLMNPNLKDTSYKWIFIAMAIAVIPSWIIIIGAIPLYIHLALWYFKHFG